MQRFFGGVSLIGGDHLDEAEATALPSVWVLHDVALFDLTILLEEAGNFFFAQSRVDTGDEEVGSWVSRAGLVIVVAALAWWATISSAILRLVANTNIAIAVSIWARRAGALTRRVVALVFVSALVSVVGVQIGHGGASFNARRRR